MMFSICSGPRAAACVLAVGLGSSVALGAVGSLSSPSELIVGGNWVNTGYVVSYEVTQNGDGTWHYEYSLRTISGGGLTPNTSHFIIQLSQNINPQTDLFNFTGPIADIEYGTFGPSPGNPGFPTGESIFGMKINTTSGVADFSFDSVRAPMWGDFYAKGANDFAYNSHLGVFVANADDYLSPALGAFGQPLNKILVPDTVIPAPGAAALLGLGGLLAARRRR
ncbi:MAG: hypothetical protein KF699_16930 [Phycisphaeraceae bacterium]|nr:hypothetical protein [Phycisphaeraceae bacterium]